MIVPTRFDPVRAQLYRAGGWWADETLAIRFESAARATPNGIALIDGRSFTFCELDQAATALAAALQQRGVSSGEVVSVQLPNWWETAVALLGVAKIGAVLNPLQMIYRQAELRFILRQCATKVLIVPHRFRGTDYLKIAAEVCAGLPTPPLLVVARGSEGLRFEELLATGASFTASSVLADAVTLLMYTSGTTAEPKGVLHTHNTLLRAAQDLVDLFRITQADRVFMASPVTHVTGLLLGFLMPWSRGAGTVLIDQWESERALDLVLEHRCSFTGGAPPFVRGFIESATKRGLKPDDIPLNRGPCGGADVPASLIYKAADVLGARFTRIYGSTEGVTVTGTAQDAPFQHAAETDGAPLPGFEIRTVDDTGADTPPGVTGEVMVRGPSNFVGYFDAAMNTEPFQSDGFFRMGDLGRWDAQGCLRIQGRKKDIIIRNGENIAAKEVEDLLITHPMVREIAIVGIPDAEVGERACAYVVAVEGVSPTLQDLCEFLDGVQIAKQKYPEYLVVVESLPKTASGKVQKFRLREDGAARGLRRSRG